MKTRTKRLQKSKLFYNNRLKELVKYIKKFVNSGNKIPEDLIKELQFLNGYEEALSEK